MADKINDGKIAFFLLMEADLRIIRNRPEE